MAYDLIHDNQQIFRKVVDSLSRPGVITSLKEEANRINFSVDGCFPSTILLARLLLDTEVTFHVASTCSEEIARRLNQLTYAKNANTSLADYIFVLNSLPEDQLEETLKLAKVGSLLDPQESATIFIEVDEISAGGQYRLTGPGIETTMDVDITLKGNWLELRNEKNAEFPLGIDLILVDKNHNLLCLPRTTQIEEIGGRDPWVMSL